MPLAMHIVRFHLLRGAVFRPSSLLDRREGDEEMREALEQTIAELVSYIKELCPDARLRVTGNRFEDEIDYQTGE
ncbi:MAG: hypothetical protein Kow0063_10770 [Anaerolineae bacterium]